MVAACALAVVVGGCGGGSSADRRPVSTTEPAATVLESARRHVSFQELRLSIDRLYRAHPGIRTFAARDVEYTPKTRDKVLSVCRSGGPEKNARALEAAKIAGCAPLVFFFYRFGRAARATDSIDVARDVYWFAVENTEGPFDAGKALRMLLQSWGIP